MAVFCIDNILLPSADSPSIATNHGNQNPCKFQKGSKVQCGCPVKYGVIKWIGMLPPENEWLYAGVEMVSLLYVWSVRMFVCVYVCLHVCVPLCVHVHVCVCVCTTVYACGCACICVFT